VKAIIWDMGGVLVRTHSRQGRQKWERELNVPPGDLERAVFRSESAQRAGLGAVSVDEHWHWVLSHYGIPFTRREEFERDFWSGDEVDHQLVNQIRDLKLHYKSGLITNAWLDIRHMLEEVWQINTAFDDMVISAEVKLAKPDPAIYHLMLQQLQVLPGESVFIDDFIENVDAARSLGMAAIQFQSPEQVMHELHQLLKKS